MRAELRVSAIVLFLVFTLSFFQFFFGIVYSQDSLAPNQIVGSGVNAGSIDITALPGSNGNYYVGSPLTFRCFGTMQLYNEEALLQSAYGIFEYNPQLPGDYSIVCGSENISFVVLGIGPVQAMAEDTIEIYETDGTVNGSEPSPLNESLDGLRANDSSYLPKANDTLPPEETFFVKSASEIFYDPAKDESTMTIGAPEPKVYDAYGRLTNFTNVVDFSWNNQTNEFTLSWKRYSLEVGTFFIYNGVRYSPDEIRFLFPGVSITGVVSSRSDYYKYGVNISNISSNLSAGLQFVGFGIQNLTGLGLENITAKGGSTLILNNELELGFSDLIENNFTLVPVNRSEVLIGNVTNKSELWLDPTIQLQTAGSANLRDTYVAGDHATTNYGTDTTMNVRDRTGIRNRAYIMFNISSIPQYVTITSAQLCLYQSTNGDTGNASVYHLTDHTWNSTTETSLTWNNQPCGGDSFAVSARCNLTPENIQSTTSTGWKCWTVTNMVNNEYASGDQNVSMVLKSVEANSLSADIYRTKEYNTDTSLRPYLNVTYTDSRPPEYSNIVQSPSGNPTYIEAVQCNATWTDNVALGTVYFQSNFSGSWQNYTPSVNGNVYNYTIPASTIAAGTSVRWRYWSNDSSGNINNTMPNQSFTMQKAASTMTLYLNGTNGDNSYGQGRNANLTGIASVIGLQVEIWTNLAGGGMTLWQSGLSPLQNITALNYPLGDYLIKANFSGNQNYTGSEDSHTLTIIDDIDPYVRINSPANDTSFNTTTLTINVTVTDLYLNYTNISIINSTGSVVNSTTNTTDGTMIVTLSVTRDGVYNITATAYDLNGNTNSTTNKNITIDTTNPSFSDYLISPNPPMGTNDVQINVTIVDSNPGTVILEWNGTTNYTVSTHSGNEYYFTIDEANYTQYQTLTYYWYADDTSGNSNRSDQQSFTAAKDPAFQTLQLQDPDTENLRDTYVASNNAGTNYGTATDVDLRDRSTRINRPHVMFNISSIPTQVSLSNAQLCLYLYNDVADTGNGSAYHVTDHTWDTQSETTMTWNNQVCGTGFTDSADCNLTAEDFQATTGVGWKCWDVTNMVRTEYAVGDANVSIVIRSNETGSANPDQFCSKESDTGSPIGCSSARRPYLNITYDDRLPPQYSNINQSPGGNPTYGIDVECNATWTDNIAVGTVYFQSNFSGAWQNYTPSVSGGIYNYTIPTSQLTGGEIVGWRYWANDTSGNINSTMPYQNFTVQKATPTITLYLNGTEGNNIYTVNENANFTAVLNVPGTVQIWTNLSGGALTLWASGASPLQNITSLSYATGTYQIKANFSANENYTFADASHNLTISTDSVPPVINTVSPINLTYGLGSYITIEANVTDNLGVDKVMLNITPPGGSPAIYEMTNVSAQIYRYSFYAWRAGDYYFSVTANDTAGNLDEYDPYIYIRANATMNISAEKYSYSLNENVTLNAGSVWNSSDLESGEIQEVGVMEPAIWTQLTYDNFESGMGSYTLGGADSILYTGGTYAHQGNNAAEVQDNSGAASSFYHTSDYDIATPNYISLKVDYWFYAVSMDATEDFWLRYSSNGGTGWTTTKAYVSGTNFVNGQFYHQTEYINESSYSFTNQARIGFQCDASANDDQVHIDELNVSASTGEYPDVQANSSYTEYQNAGSVYVGEINALKFTVYVSAYNFSGSAANSNSYPDLQIEANNGTDWVSLGNMSVNTTGNFTIYTENPSILQAWETEDYRDLRLRAVGIDYNSSSAADKINWTGVWAQIYNGSILINEHDQNLSGYLVMAVERNSSGSWENIYNILDDVSLGTLRNVTYGSYLDTGSLWNPNPWNTRSNQTGIYRVHSYLADSSGNILNDSDGLPIETYSLFELTIFKNTNATPSIVGYGQNVTISTEVMDNNKDKVYVYIKRPGESSYTGYEMVNISSSIFQYNYSNTWRWGDYSYYIWENNTDGYNSTGSSSEFGVRANNSLLVLAENTTYGPMQDVNLTGNATSWWNDSYRYRQRINVTNQNSSLVMETNYSVKVVVDTEALISAQKLKIDGYDLRIAWYNSTSGTWTELDRVNETAFNLTNTEIWFAIKQNISAGGSNSDYYMYYSNPAATAPLENRSRIYIWWDDFSSNTLTRYNLSRWVDIHGDLVNYNAPTYDAVNKRISFDTGDNIQSDMYPANVTAKDLIIESDFFITGSYPANATIAIVGRMENPGGTSTHYYFDYSAQSTYPSPGITIDSWARGERNNFIYQENPYYFFAWNQVQNIKYAIYGNVHSVWVNRNITQSPDIYAINNTHMNSGRFGLVPAQAIGWLDNFKVRRFVGTDPGTAFSSEEDRLKSRLYNYGSTNISGYLEMRVQRYSGGSWVNFEPAFVNDRIMPVTIRNISSGGVIMLDEIWNPAGWDTALNTPGNYRAYVRLTDSSGATLVNDDSSLIEGVYEFSILSPYLELTNLTHENNMSAGINEYETGDNIAWINVTVTNRNSTSINSSVTLNVLDSSSAYVGWGPQNETSSCGNMTINQTCMSRFDNSSSGYALPLNVTSGAYNFFWNVSMSSLTGVTTYNKTQYFIIRHIPDNLSSSIGRTKIFQNQSTIYNLTIKNPWTKNLTNINVSINFPAITGLNVTCLSTGLTYCSLANLSGGGTYTFSFNVTTNNTPAGDYPLNATINYTNPGLEIHSWAQQQNRVISVRIPGQFVVIDSYPANITRGQSGYIKGYSNNTLGSTMHNVWLNWTLPSGWSNTTGNLSLMTSEQLADALIWNNITAYVGISSALGPQTIDLKSTSDEGYEDNDTAIITIYADTNITNIASNNTGPTRDEVIRISGKLVLDNGTALSGKTIIITDETDGILAGTNLTDASGNFYIYYNISGSAALGNHVLNASFAGLLASYYFSSWNTTNISVYDKPDIKNVMAFPESQGYGYNVTISANVTDTSGVDKVRVCVTPPSTSATCYDLVNYTAEIYEYNFSNTWGYGNYTYYVWANNTAGKSSQSASYQFHIGADIDLGLGTIDSVYGPNEDVNLTSPSDWWNYSWDYRRRINVSELNNTILTDYVVNVTIDTASLISSGKLQSACQDIRVVNGTTQLPYGIRGATCNTTATILEFEINISASSFEDDVYVYYGSPTAANNESVIGYSNDSNTEFIYHFTEGSGASSYDYSTGAHNASLFRSPAWSNSTPRFGRYSIDLPGVNEYLEEGTSMGIGAGTLEMWMRLDESFNSTSLYSQGMFGAWSDATNHLEISLCGQDRVDANCLDGGLMFETVTAATGSDFCASLRTNWTRDQWYHVAVTWNGTRRNIYIDGVLDKVCNDNGRPPIPGANLMIGAARIDQITDDPIKYFKGQIDEVRGSNAARGVTELLSRGVEPGVSFIGSEQNFTNLSLVYNDYSAGFKGYLLMKVQKYEGGLWSDVTRDNPVVNDASPRSITAKTILALDNIWNSPGEGSGWNTDKDIAGRYRVYLRLSDASGNILRNDDGSYMNYTSEFNISEPAAVVEVTNIKIYDVTNAADKKSNTSNLSASGLNTTFNIFTTKTYRAEITVWNSNASQSEWTVNSSNILFHDGLDNSWNVSILDNIWYSNGTDNFTGGEWLNGKISWNTSLGGTVPVDKNLTLYYVFEANSSSAGGYQVHFVVNDTQFNIEDYSVYNLIVSESGAPQVYNNIYDVTRDIIHRNESFSVYARWQEAMKEAFAEFNSTNSSFRNYTISITEPNPENWTNYTLVANTSWLLGDHSVKISGSDMNDNWNNELDYLPFQVWGWANITSASLNASTIINGSSVTVSCKVISDNSSAIGGYNISFYNSTSLLGVNSTNSTGWATWSYTDYSLGYENITCNITHDAGIYYNASSSNSQVLALRTLETTSPWYDGLTSNSTTVHRGENVTYEVYWYDNVWLGHSWIESNETGSLRNNTLSSAIYVNATDRQVSFNALIPTNSFLGPMAWRIYANDTSSNKNNTSPFNYTNIWGYAIISASNMTPNPIYVNQTTNITCRVTDYHTGSAISAYNISFYSNETGLLGTNPTNSTGWAIWTYNDTTEGWETITCNITTDPQKYYDPYIPNNASQQLRAALAGQDTTPPNATIYSINTTSVWKGGSILAYANWSETVGGSNITYNSTTSSLQAYSPDTIAGSWTNHTIATTSNWLVGNHSVKINASDVWGNWNNTLSYLTFNVWGRSKVAWYLPTTSTYRGNFSLMCRVYDKDNNTGISNYPVLFYNSSWDYLGTSNTNSTGIANYTIDALNYAAGSSTFYCTISNNGFYTTTTTDDDTSGSFNLMGRLNVTLIYPATGLTFHKGEIIILNSSTKDENNLAVIPASALWYNSTTQIASGENTSWQIPLTHTLGSQTIQANVSKQYYDSDSKNTSINIWGWSNVSWSSPAGGTASRGANIQLECHASDSNTSFDIQNYPVYFYYKNSTETDYHYLGYNLSNSNGYADKVWATSGLALGVYSVKCNMTHNSTIYYNATSSNQANTSIELTEPTGYLEVNLMIPPTITGNGDAALATGYKVGQNRTFLIKANVTCRNGPCGTVQGTVRYNGSGSDPNTVISTSSAMPFHIADTSPQNPISCGSLSQDQSCSVNWTINSTGSLTSVWNLDVLFEASQTASNDTGNAPIQISIVLIMSLSAYNLSATVDPEVIVQKIPMDGCPLYISLNNNSNDAEGLYVKGTNLTGPSGYNMSAGNMSYYTADLPGFAIPVTEYYQNLASPAPAGINQSSYYWINSPQGVAAGTYTGFIYIMANATG